MILFITINLNGIEIIKNYIHPFRLPKKITHLVLPALTYNSNLVGRTIKISHKKVVPTMVVDRELLRSMPIEGQLIRRMVCEEDLRWYLLQTKTTFIFRDTVVSYFYIKTKDEEADLSGTSFKNIEIRIPKHMVDKAQPTFEKSKTIHLTNLIAKETR